MSRCGKWATSEESCQLPTGHSGQHEWRDPARPGHRMTWPLGYGHDRRPDPWTGPDPDDYGDDLRQA